MGQLTSAALLTANDFQVSSLGQLQPSLALDQSTAFACLVYVSLSNGSG